MIILRHVADLRGVVVVVAALAVFALQWSGFCRHPLLWAIGLLLAYTTFVVNHSHQHLPMFRATWLNRAFDFALTFASGFPVSLLIPLHNCNHHDANNGPDDFMSTGRLRIRWPWLRLLLYPIVSAIAYAPRKRQVLRDLLRNSPRLYWRIAAQRLTLLAGVGILLALRPLDTLVIVMLPWALAHYWVINANYLQHEGCDHASPDAHSRNLTGRLLNWWLFNGGYHTVHHEHPLAHWSELPALHAARVPALDRDLTQPFAPTLLRLLTGRYRRHGVESAA